MSGEQEKRSCCGPIRYNMVFACSGASDVGEITDRAARNLSRKRAAAMCCSAAIGANIEDIVGKAKGANQIVVIDGCSHDCSRLILERAGFKEFVHVQLEDMGMEKSKSPVSDERIEKVVEHAEIMLKEKNTRELSS